MRYLPVDSNILRRNPSSVYSFQRIICGRITRIISRLSFNIIQWKLIAASTSCIARNELLNGKKKLNVHRKCNRYEARSIDGRFAENEMIEFGGGEMDNGNVACVKD